MPQDINAPIPLRNKVLSTQANEAQKIMRPSSSIDLSNHAKRAKLDKKPLTPDPAGMDSKTPQDQDLDAEDQLIKQRLKHYNLDYPDSYEEYLKESSDKKSKFFARAEARKLDLKNLLPYQAESHKDQAKYLTHVLVHLYIAIKSLDLEGLVSISTKDLANIRNDIELTLDTDFFNADLSFDYENVEQDEDDEDEEDAKGQSGVIGKLLPRSATIISVNHWTNELKTCLKAKFDIPLSLRASLAKVYYYLALSKGQSINSQLFIDLFVKLTYKYRDLLIESNKLILDHKPLINYIVDFFPDVDPTYDIYSPTTDENDKKIFNLSMKLALNSNCFFAPSAMRELYDFSLSRFSIPTAFTSLTILCNSLPVFFNESDSIMDFIPSLFYFWTNNTSIKALDINIIDLLGRISRSVYFQIANGSDKPKFGKFGIYTEDQINFIFNNLQNNLRNDFKVSSFYGVARILVFSINNENFEGFFQKLKVLLNSIETYAHPSNTGSWSILVARFCHRFIKQYHKRIIAEKDEDSKVPKEVRLSPETNAKIISAFKEIVLLGSQAKKDSVSNYYIATLGYLTDLEATNKFLLVNQVLIDLYDSLTDQFINSSHRIIVALKQFTEISRFMIHDKIYRIHMTNLMSLLLSKIGTNDLNLTNNVFNTLVTVGSLVPFKDLTTEIDFISFESTTLGFIQDHLFFLKEHPHEEFSADQSTIHNAFLGSTKIFNDLTKTLVDKLFLLVEADLNERLIFKITQSLLILTQSFSDEVFESFAKCLENKFHDENLNNVNENEVLIANIYGALIKSDERRFGKLFKQLDYMIREELEQGAGSIRNKTSTVLGRDKKLVLYLSILGEVLSVSYNQVLNHKEEFMNLIQHLYEKISNPSLHGLAANIIHKTLLNLTKIKLRENKLFNNEENIKYEEYWGGKQFDSDRFEKERLSFKWYIPTNTEVSFAIEVFETIVVETLSKIEELTKHKDDSELSFSDEFTKNLLYISSSLSGNSILFDPDYTSDQADKNENFTGTSLQRKLMILKSLRASKTDNNELNIDIEEITKHHEDVDLVSERPVSEDRSDVKEDFKEILNGVSEDVEGINIDDEVPSSRMLTPMLQHESDLTSIMNSSVAFRELKIYNCNYFFGNNSSEKKSYTNYGHIHSLRSLVGHGLHKVYEYLAEHQNENLYLFQALLHTVESYFCDVGKVSTLDFEDELFIDYTFLKRVQSIGNYTKPFTRTCLGARIEKFHRQRVILHSTNRFQTKLDKLLLQDLVEMSTSSYPSVHQPSQMVMIETMKKLIGSYSLILHAVVQNVEKSIAEKDLKRIEAGLRIFRLKKIHNKLLSDYTNIGKITQILCQCLMIDNLEISGLAQLCLNDFSTSLRIPSAIARFEVVEIDGAIRPPDKCIDLEIQTVKAAKDAKREFYMTRLDDLQELLIKAESENEHWKLSVLYLKFLTNIQAYYEVPTKGKVLELLILKSKHHHPTLVRLCIKASTKLFEKTVRFAIFKYSLENSFDNQFQRDGMVKIDTTDSFSDKFKKEMENFEDPKYFIDGRAFKGWLFWDKFIQAVDSTKAAIDVQFNDADQESLKLLGSLITKDWLNLILKTLMQDNETKGVFQSIDVFMFSTIVHLISLGFTTLTYQELLHLVTENYIKDEKASVIIVAELICGLLIATNHTTKENIQARDSFLVPFLDSVVLHDLAPDTSGVWNIVFWWVPSRIDVRRVPILAEKAMNLGGVIDVDSNLAFIQSSRVNFARSYLASLGWRFNDAEKLFDTLVFEHPYQLVRDQVGSLVATLAFTIFRESYDNSQKFIDAQNHQELGLKAYNIPESFAERIKGLFNRIESLRLETSELSAQDLLKSEYFYIASTVLKWLEDGFSGLFSISLSPYVCDYIAPFLMNLENNRELCKLAGISPGFVYYRMASIAYRPEIIPDILKVATKTDLSIHQLQIQLTFIERFFSRQLLQLTPEQKQQLLVCVDKLLFHNSVEVRTKAASVLSGFIHSSQDLEGVGPFINKYVKTLGKRRPKNAKLANEEAIKLHASAMGLGALISAFPYVSPPPAWMPSRVCTLARASSLPGIIGKSAKDTLSTFKKIRSDTWHIDRTSFTEEQLEDLEGVLWRSYFA